jgi:hypothetical protein
VGAVVGGVGELSIEEAPFSRLIIRYAKAVIPLLDLYLKHIVLLNYAFVALVIGTSISYLIYHSLVFFIWEPVAYWSAVLIAGLSNFAFSVGPLGHLFGLKREVKPVG